MKKKRSIPSDAGVPEEEAELEGERTVSSFPIVGIGASAGGLEAFTQLLQALPLETGMGFVLVQHLDPEHDSALTQILSRVTSLPVLSVTNNQTVLPNHVYIIPPDTNLTIAHGVLNLQPRPKTRTPPRPIDSFFESLALDQHERAIGVVLSGTASDGTLGLEAIKVEGGITFAQDASAKYDSMPRSAIAASCVDLVLSPTGIAEELARIAKHPYVVGQSLEISAPTETDLDATSPRENKDATSNSDRLDDEHAKVLSLLRKHCGVDFSLYKSSTIQRRIARRLVINRQNTLKEYAEYLQGNTKELDSLCSDVLISVTSFFRNPEAFEALQLAVLPELLKQPGEDPIRVWVPGCSSGQEAYSIVMAFMESAEKVPRKCNLQVFATDLNEKMLVKARAGLYPKSLAQEISPERLQQFFVEEQGGYRVNKSIREMVVFARQNLFSDPPFSRMDLISCRNLLIYLGPSLQKKAIPTFHYALKPDGFLMLGASESVAGFSELFEPIDRKYKIYSRKNAARSLVYMPTGHDQDLRTTVARRASKLSSDPSQPSDVFVGERNAQREADRITLHRYSPPGVLINADLQVLQFRGSTGAYLEPPVGKASFDVLKMAREGLMLPLRAAINESQHENAPTRRENVRVIQDGKNRLICFEVIPLKNQAEPCFLILFEEAEVARRTMPRPPRIKPPLSKRDETSRITELENELAETRDYLLDAQEQYALANDELLAAGEELQSANEELQSINEELETSKEELESSNEELSTVNDEMTHRNSELSVLNNDLVNFQNSTRLILLLIGHDLTIRRFSPQAEKQFDLMVSDVGRPISHIRHNLVHGDDGKTSLDLGTICLEVISTAAERVLDVKDKGGRWHSLRVRPYTTIDQRIDGAVLVLLEIDELKQNEQAVAAARDYAQNIVESLRSPLLVLDKNLNIESANPSFYRVFGVEPADVIGKSIYHLCDKKWDIPRLRELLEEILLHRTSIEEFQIEFDFETLGHRTMLLNARHVLDPLHLSERILLAVDDITDRVVAEQKLHASETLYRRLFETAKDGVLILDAKSGKILDANPFMTEITGFSTAEFIGKELWEIGLFEDRAANEAAFQELQQNGYVRYNHLPLKSKNNHQVDVEIVSNVYQWDHRSVAQCNFRDISDRIRLEIQNTNQAAELADLNRRKDEFLAMLSHELRNPLAPIVNAIHLLRLQENEDELQRDARNVIERQVSQMTRLIDDLMEVSRISTGRIHLRHDRVDLIEIVKHAVETVRPSIEERQQSIELTVPPHSIWMVADALRIEQVVVNLLTNASKYMDNGGIVAIAVEQDDNEAVFRVLDQGVGIAPDLLPCVFDLFTQSQRSLDRSQGGLGIGLALVKRLVEMHNGRVEVCSELGKGSEFIVRLPIVSSSEPKSPANEVVATIARKLRILVVDDMRDTTHVLSTLLKRLGHDVRTAADGHSGLIAALEFRPNVMLMDIGLPGIDGYEVAKRIRQEPTLKQVMLVALTGYGGELDRQRSHESGFDHHLVKPADINKIRPILETVPQEWT